MNYDLYLEKFKKAAAQLDQRSFKEKQLEIATGIVLNSVYLKLYKKKWLNEKEDEKNASSKIFFSIWVNDKSLKENKIFYNIHALKLRQLKGYSIASRDFAEQFRNDFRKVKQDWENVRVDLGPLTLMEGWYPLHPDNIETTVRNLAMKFLAIEHLIDKALKRFEN